MNTVTEKNAKKLSEIAHEFNLNVPENASFYLADDGNLFAYTMTAENKYTYYAYTVPVNVRTLVPMLGELMDILSEEWMRVCKRLTN